MAKKLMKVNTNTYKYWTAYVHLLRYPTERANTAKEQPGYVHTGDRRTTNNT